MKLSPGKWRRLQQCTSAAGALTVLAIDHRGPLRRVLAKLTEDELPETALPGLKRDIVRELSPASSAVLLDPETGVAPCVISGALPGPVGLLVAMDTGSTGDPTRLETSLVENWCVEDVRRIGASGVKLLVYYHPDASEAATTEAVIRRIGEACAQCDLPFFLEPLSYSIDGSSDGLPSAERRRVVVETARRLVPLGVDILKAEFPVNVAEETNPSNWRAACQELSEACTVPWVILSAGVPFETFLQQTEIACRSGASGVMVGRAVWKEAITLDVEGRCRFLKGEGLSRLSQLRGLCDELGRPMWEIHDPMGLEINDVREIARNVE